MSSRLQKLVLIVFLFSSISSFSQEGFIGEVRMFAGNFAPRGWAFCDGQLLAISNNTALFSILGTTYGGDGRTTFALPDLRGRVAVGVGQGPGLTNRRQGERYGAETSTLTVANLPAHNHSINLKTGDGGSNLSSKSILPIETNTSKLSYSSSTNNEIVNNNGGNQSFSITQPSIAIRYIICLQGIYPSRN